MMPIRLMEIIKDKSNSIPLTLGATLTALFQKLTDQFIKIKGGQ